MTAITGTVALLDGRETVLDGLRAIYLFDRLLSPRKLHPLSSPKHLDFVTEKNSFFCHFENTVFQTLPKNAFFIRVAHFLLFLGGSNNHSLVQNQRVYRSFSPKKSFVG